MFRNVSIAGRRTRQVPAIASTLLILLLNGCASPDGIAPHAQLRESTTQLAHDHPDSDAVDVSANWWQAFNDDQLNTLLQQAFTNSPTLKEAAARIREAQAAAGNAHAQGAVHLNGEGGLNARGWPEDDYYGGPNPGKRTWDNSADLSLDYELDLFNRQSDRDRRASANIGLSHANAEAARLQLSGNIVRTYIELALQYQLRDVQLARLKQQHSIVKLTRQQFDLGLGSQYDLQQAQALVPVTRRQIRALDQQIALLKNQLITLAGLPIINAAKVKRPALKIATQLKLPQKLPLNLIGHRPDLVASRWHIVAQARSVDLARADFYPNINLTASLGQIMTAGGLDNLFTAANHHYEIGPAISLPILDGGARRANLGIESARYDQVVEQYNSTLLGALRQVSDELIRQQSAEDQARLADQSVALADRVYHTAAESFRRGLEDYLHVLDSQTRLFDQQMERERVHAQLLQSQASLAVALGGGINFQYQPGDDSLTPERVDVVPLTAATKTDQETE